MGEGIFSPWRLSVRLSRRVYDSQVDGTNRLPFFLFRVPVFLFCFLKVTVPVSGMITIPAASLAGAQIVQTGANTNTTSSGQGTVTVTLPVAGNVVNSGGMVMVRKAVPHLCSGTGAFHGLPVSAAGCEIAYGVNFLELNSISGTNSGRHSQDA